VANSFKMVKHSSTAAMASSVSATLVTYSSCWSSLTLVASLMEDLVSAMLATSPLFSSSRAAFYSAKVSRIPIISAISYSALAISEVNY